jgi:septum formation protein
MKMRNIILASTSPRRKEILAKTKLPFLAVPSNYEEDMTLKFLPVELAKYLSYGKASSLAKDYKDAVIIGADTFVVFQNKLLGKPKSEKEAIEMLKMLRGKENDLITGVTIIDALNKKEKSFHEISKVFMKDISDEMINAYVKTGEPLQMAGAYSIQELGAIFIEKIEGDFFNAMGLPLSRLVEELKEFEVNVL